MKAITVAVCMTAIFYGLHLLIYSVSKAIDKNYYKTATTWILLIILLIIGLLVTGIGTFILLNNFDN